ncbi:hypothetical protein CHS0354_025807 [Potamilus streckersoni]|uniref:Uncharacterized protein n=1 Tax=Potamilus streckersoni TaxID=2493646 RepID=A0AAE0TC19_9BIVA|nr:hypothetical protein CHS0354_025807 [Potamilus streckersoni]
MKDRNATRKVTMKMWNAIRKVTSEDVEFHKEGRHYEDVECHKEGHIKIRNDPQGRHYEDVEMPKEGHYEDVDATRKSL